MRIASLRLPQALVSLFVHSESTNGTSPATFLSPEPPASWHTMSAPRQPSRIPPQHPNYLHSLTLVFRWRALSLSLSRSLRMTLTTAFLVVGRWPQRRNELKHYAHDIARVSKQRCMYVRWHDSFVGEHLDRALSCVRSYLISPAHSVCNLVAGPTRLSTGSRARAATSLAAPGSLF